MPIALRGATLTAATSPGAIYVWTKTKENALCELRNEISDTKLAEAIRKNDIDVLSPPKDKWVAESFQDVECDPHSTLCGVAWDDSSQSIFYQDDHNNILEWRRLAGQKWQTDIVGQLSCLKGTNIAVVHSAHGHRAMLFFQDDKNNICFSRGEFRKWGPAEVVAPAAKLTGIGATSWDGKPELEQVALYFQGERGSINEYRGSFSDGLHLYRQFEVRELPKKHLIGDITAISWNSSGITHLRLYFQDAKNRIIEYTNEGDSGWRLGELKQECFPNADIIAVPRVAGLNNQSYCVNVFWVGLDQKVAQSVYLAQSKWSKASTITDDSSVGMFVGSNEGTSFSGDDDEVDNKHVRTVNIRLFDDDNISALWLDFTDGQSSEIYGVKTGTLKQFVLNEGEEITHVWVPAPGPDEPINSLRFGTSHGRRSEWFGQDHAKYVKQWSQEGHPLVGFWGATDRENSYIIGLGPVFATRESNLDLRVVSELVSRQPELTKRRQAIDGEIRNIQHATNTFKDETDRVRTQEASTTIRQLAVLAHTIEYYSDLSRASQKARLGPYPQRQADVARERSSCDKTAHALFVDIQTVLAKCVEVRRQGDQLRFRLDQATKDFNLILDDFRFRYLKENVKEILTVLRWEEAHAKDEWQDCHRFFDNSKKPEDVQRVGKAQKKKTDLMNKIKTLTAFHTELEKFHVETLRSLAYLLGLVNGATAALEAFAALAKYDAYNPSRIDWTPKRFASELYEVSRIVFAQPQLKEQFASETSSPDELVDTLRGIMGTTVGN